MINLAFELIRANSNDLRFVAYELVAHHKPTFSHITEADLLKLGTGIDSWSSVDCFAMILSGPCGLKAAYVTKPLSRGPAAPTGGGDAQPSSPPFSPRATETSPPAAAS
jgi:hypothetical protein